MELTEENAKEYLSWMILEQNDLKNGYYRLKVNKNITIIYQETNKNLLIEFNGNIGNIKIVEKVLVGDFLAYKILKELKKSTK